MNPAARAFLRRWRDVLIAAGWAAGALALLGPAAAAGAALPAGLLAGALALALWLARDGWRRARLARGVGPGLVAVREGSVAYFGPLGGGIADLDALTAIEIEPGPVWVLRGEGAPPLRIPSAADGAEALADAFAALPGFDPARLSRALAAPDVSAPVWRRPRAPGAVRLLPR